MKLQNPFSVEKREAFRDYQYRCWDCGGNGQDCGGTELHHIQGRNSSSVFNGAVLCKKCHAKVLHIFAEESKYMKRTFFMVMRMVEKGNYKLDEDDKNFLKENEKYYTVSTV